MSDSEFQNTVNRYKQELLDMSVKQKTLVEENSDINKTYSEFLKENPKTGQLKIQANTAGGSLPTPGVLITVSKDFKDGKKVFFEGKTDSNGIINGVVLPAPNRSLSETPSNIIPYASYYITAVHSEYESEEYINTNIFDGIKSIQPVRLVPKGL